MNSHLLNLIIKNVTTHNFSASDVGEDNTNSFGCDNYSACNFSISCQVSTIMKCSKLSNEDFVISSFIVEGGFITHFPHENMLPLSKLMDTLVEKVHSRVCRYDNYS